MNTRAYTLIVSPRKVASFHIQKLKFVFHIQIAFSVTKWSKVLPEKLLFYRTRRLITGYTRCGHWSLFRQLKQFHKHELCFYGININIILPYAVIAQSV
jgi:hypothetical protein